MAKDLLVGSTGFVGGNLAAKHAFAAVCHSTDIAAQFGAKPDLCVYAGVPAAMFLANADPDADLAVMAAARENLRQIAPKQLVLISSIAVYADSRGKDEQSPMTPDGLPAYGRNRLQLERWVREDYPNALIVRLPALYGIGLKKNFLFDLHTITPAMLKPEKYTELAQKSPLVRDGYTLADNGFYKLNGAVDAAALRESVKARALKSLPAKTVSYTHLTLPTTYSVYISVFALSLKKKTHTPVSPAPTSLVSFLAFLLNLSTHPSPDFNLSRTLS